MSQKFTYNKYQVDKLGNAIIYLTDNFGAKLYKTNLLKLIYIIEEASIKKFGIPFFNIDFKIWKLGPVNKEVYYELSEDLDVLSGYISVKESDYGRYIKSLREFNDDEFSRNDLEILQEVIETFKGWSSEELVNYTHEESKPWYVQASAEGLIDDRGILKESITDIEIDFSKILDPNTFQHFVYSSAKDCRNAFDSLN